MISLCDWQDDFAAMLRGAEPRSPDVRNLAAAPGAAVYRNTVWKGWIDAIEANFPAVASLVGSEWARAAAAAFATDHPPQSPVLTVFGADFPQFLSSFPPAEDMPWLADVAALDRGWTQAHTAEDASVLEMAELAGLTADQMAVLRLVPHPAGRAFWFETTVPDLWLFNRPDYDDGELRFTDEGQGLLIARPVLSVEALRLDRAAYAFLRACADRDSLLDAATRTLAADPTADLVGLLESLVGFGAFTRIQRLSQ